VCFMEKAEDKRRKPIEGVAVILRYPNPEDAEEFTEASRNSRELHEGFVNPPLDGAAFIGYVLKNDDDSNESFLIIEKETGSIAGAINLSQIFMGPFRSAYLGYYLFEGFTGRGLMTDAVRTLLRWAFGEFGLHRAEANIQPENSSSIELVRRCGFTKEGYSRKYLMVDGVWRDHERWAILQEEFEG
jgi:ribosomal-protein-alanine N-acetyltransferase